MCDAHRWCGREAPSPKGAGRRPEARTRRTTYEKYLYEISA